MSKRSLLYTEMISAAALVRGNAIWNLDHHPREHPVALQLGGSDPDELRDATRMGIEAGFDEINLNAGCPSDRVREGCFGAVLMCHPGLVRRCLESMISVSGDVEVTVKCRIGVDDQDPEMALPKFLEALAQAGVGRVAIHARKAWLKGLSPKQNRNVPPLDHDLVVAMKSRFPEMRICVNGGIADLDAAERLLDIGIDGVMLGRAAYRAPCATLLGVDRRIFGMDTVVSRREVALEMLAYIGREAGHGTKINQITRHMMGLYSGCHGARAWRQALSDGKRIAREGTSYISQLIERLAETEPVSDRPA